MGDYRDFEAAALKNPEFYELNDQLNFLKMYENILTLIYSLHSNLATTDIKQRCFGVDGFIDENMMNLSKYV